MSRLEAMADAVLYEGYLLYPYRASALKNRQRWPLGVLHPAGFCAAAREGDAAMMTTEILVDGAATIDVKVRFLHLGARAEAGAWDFQEGLPREVLVRALGLAELLDQPRAIPFTFAAADEENNGIQRRWESIEGLLTIAAEPAAAGVVRVRARIENRTAFDHLSVGGERDGEGDRAALREAALRRAFASTHTLFWSAHGDFVSLLDPPDHLRAAVAACNNIGTWPVLAGASGARDAILSSPIILYDHPQIAPESPGDLFDGAEIDEILTLRILTLSDDEKREVMATDPRARALLERTEALDHHAVARLHGSMRSSLTPGARVRLAPHPGGDIFDLALAGRAATVTAIERDLEGRVHVAVTVDDDPGRDLGAQGMPGHRFFFRPDEVEPL